MASVVYNPASPYKNTFTFGNNYLDILNFRDIPKSADDILYSITSNYQYRPDLLAYDLYGDARLWWVFIARNKNSMIDPIWDFKSGISIYLPKKSTITTVLGI